MLLLITNHLVRVANSEIVKIYTEGLKGKPKRTTVQPEYISTVEKKFKGTKWGTKEI